METVDWSVLIFECPITAKWRKRPDPGPLRGRSLRHLVNARARALNNAKASLQLLRLAQLKPTRTRYRACQRCERLVRPAYCCWRLAALPSRSNLVYRSDCSRFARVVHLGSSDYLFGSALFLESIDFFNLRWFFNLNRCRIKIWSALLNGIIWRQIKMLAVAAST